MSDPLGRPNEDVSTHYVTDTHLSQCLSTADRRMQAYSSHPLQRQSAFTSHILVLECLVQIAMMGLSPL